MRLTSKGSSCPGFISGITLIAVLLALPATAQQQAFSMLDGHLVRMDLETAQVETIDGSAEDRISDLTTNFVGELIGLRFAVIGGELDELVILDPATGAVQNVFGAATSGITGMTDTGGFLWFALDDLIINFVGATGPVQSFNLPWPAGALAGDGATLYAIGGNSGQVELATIDLDSKLIEVQPIAGVTADLIDDAAVDGDHSVRCAGDRSRAIGEHRRGVAVDIFFDVGQEHPLCVHELDVDRTVFWAHPERVREEVRQCACVSLLVRFEVRKRRALDMKRTVVERQAAERRFRLPEQR